MDHLWKLMCCGQGQAREDDSSLLHPEGPGPLEPMSASSSSSSSSSASSSTTITSTNKISKNIHQAFEAEANEGATQMMLDCLGQMADSSAPSVQQALATCLAFIPSQLLRLYILSHLLDSLPKAPNNNNNNNNNNKLAPLQRVISTLDSQQRAEVSQIISGLPASVFGDQAARDRTRVLVDLLADTKESLLIDRQRVAPHRRFVDGAIEMLQQTLASVPPGQQEGVLTGVLQQQAGPLRLKLALRLLVLSRALLPDPAARAEFMLQLMSSY